MKLGDFDYELPEEAIAQHPLPERDASRLMVLRRDTGEVRHHIFRDLPDLLLEGDLLVMNRSRVLPARLLGRRRGGGSAEVLLLRRLGPLRWEALVRPGRRLRSGDAVVVGDAIEVRIESGPVGRDGRREVRLQCDRERVDELLERYGRTPLPPYIRREPVAEDRERYQTLYAREEGSVAAPTAGLHFSHELLRRLADRGIGRAEVVLHVGLGTFQPVRTEDVADHRLPPEPSWVPAETAAAVRLARTRGGRIVGVGTTAVRVMESVAQADGTIEAWEGETELVIVPGFRFRVTEALLTNFHLPRSSLLLLVCAFAGRERILDAYRQAIRAGYRFYSYGDAMLIL